MKARFSGTALTDTTFRGPSRNAEGRVGVD